MILAALDSVGGQKYFERHAEQTPQAFMMLIGKAMPAELKAELTGGPVKIVVVSGLSPKTDA